MAQTNIEDAADARGAKPSAHHRRLRGLWRPPAHHLVPEASMPAAADEAAELDHARATLWGVLRAFEAGLAALQERPARPRPRAAPPPDLGTPFRAGAALPRAFALLAAGRDADHGADLMAAAARHAAAFAAADARADDAGSLSALLARTPATAGPVTGDAFVDVDRLMRVPARHPALRVLRPILSAPDQLAKHTPSDAGLARAKARVRAEMTRGGAHLDAAFGRLGLAALTLALGAEHAAAGRLVEDRPPAAAHHGVDAADIRLVDETGRAAPLNGDDPVDRALALATALAHTAGAADPAEMEALAVAATLALAEVAARRSFLARLARRLDRARDVTAPEAATLAIPPEVAARTREGVAAALQLCAACRAELPGLGAERPAVHNLWGVPVRLPVGLGPDTMAPTFVDGAADAAPDTLTRELARLGQPIRLPRDVLPHAAGPVRLRPAEHARLCAIEGGELTHEGRTLRAALERIVAGHDEDLSPVYAEADDAGKAAILGDVAARYRQHARTRLLAEFPSLLAETGDHLRPAIA